MKSNILVKQFPLRTELVVVIVVVVCVSSQAFKLPINLKRSMKDVTDLVESRQLREESSDVGKVLFPEKSDSNEDKDYQIQLSFRSQDEVSGEQTESAVDNAGLERFYKYSLKTQPTADELIVFPREGDRIEQTQMSGDNENDPSIGIDTSSNSGGNLFENIQPGTENKDTNSSNTINFRQSLEILAQMVHQLLFREPVTGISVPIVPTGSSELDVQEQSLYSGPKLKAQSATSECPDGTKKNRNGACQKPSRRLVSS